jgi:hypothetical protein
MPWNIDDVEKFNKGLTPRLKKQWVRIANSVLKAELKKGKDEKEAAAEAVKQANGVVMNNNKDSYATYKTKQVLDYEVKLTVHNEKPHLVVPVVMMVEGVHNGSQGPLFHSITELGKFPESWNGIPVVIYHPEEDGQSVSANSPDIIDKMTVGRVYNTQVEGKKLKAEVWLDEDKLNTVSEKTLNDVNDTKEVEVSLGMFTENEMEEGDYNGEKYVGIAHNHRPDHLAILPDQIGACSCADGCGLGANQDITGDVEVFAGTSETSTVSIGSINVNLKKETKMERSECTPCVEKKVSELIANSQGRLIDSDKEWLQTLTEVQLDKLMDKKACDEEEDVTTAACKKKVVKQEEAPAPVVQSLSPEDQAALAYGRKQLKERKEKMIKGIQDNTEKGTWDDATLNAMGEDILERVFNSVKKEDAPVNYGLNAGGNFTSNAGGEEPLYPAGVEIKK